MLTTPPLSLYIHMPWCVKKCPYCDFNSHQKTADIPVADYINRLCQQIKQTALAIKDRPIISIFIGGGTPNLIAPAYYEQLFTTLFDHYRFIDNIEITMEANPGAKDNQQWQDYFSLGINRLSIGAQSFNDQQLQHLGRIHSSKEIIKTYEDARNAGFNNINIDVMHGLIEQTVDEALTDLQTALTLQPEHISWYQLTLEPNTLFAAKPPLLTKTDDIIYMEQAGVDLLKQHGFKQYEVSAYAKNNKQCQHNLNYWQFGDYLGLGAGAHGKVTDINTQQITRTTHYKRPQTFIDSDKIYATETIIDSSDLAFEFMLNALRLQQPLQLDLFEKRTGLCINTIQPLLQQLQKQKLLEQSAQAIHITALGRQYLNDIISAFL